MSSLNDTFFTSVGCMDGRVQSPIAKYGQKKFGVKYPDTITEAGMVGLLGKENPEPTLIDSVKFKIGISVNKHNSKGIIVHGHTECAGNPVDDEVHRESIRKSVELVKKLIDHKVPVYGVFVKKQGKDWVVEEL